jgi:pseudouridine-5'-phosphate glycosidase
VLLAVPPPESIAPGEVERAIETAESEAASRGIAGPDRTPHVLAAVARATGGRTLRANLALLEENARVAGAVAVCLAASLAERKIA